MTSVYFELTVMIILWSLSFIVVDIGVEIVPPLSLALYRFILASICFLIIHLYTRIKNNKKQISNHKGGNLSKYNKKDWLLIIIASFTGISFFFLSQYNAIAIIGPSLPALFVCLLAPIIVSTLALIFFEEKLNKIKILGFGIATIGGYLLVTGGNLDILNPQSVNFLGYFFALLTPILWAIYSTSTKFLTKTKSTLRMLEFITYFGTIELFFLVLINNELITLLLNMNNPILFFCCIYLGLVCHILGYYIWNNSQKQIASSKAVSFLYIEPFLTLIFSFLLQRSEIILPLNIIGGIIVLIAVLIINSKK
ncbi:MAG: EamA family transporter [Candidatus Lokiarchaeota archaeon]|nr:EamA family transporter [Candidatus Lokiarchaeota archaeon]MBD3198618.1 EamA family transporter [Candidatus Lokiarchaeota archaeon]